MKKQDKMITLKVRIATTDRYDYDVKFSGTLTLKEKDFEKIKEDMVIQEDVGVEILLMEKDRRKYEKEVQKKNEEED